MAFDPDDFPLIWALTNGFTFIFIFFFSKEDIQYLTAFNLQSFLKPTFVLCSKNR